MDLTSGTRETFVVKRAGVEVPWDQLAEMTGGQFAIECKLFVRAAQVNPKHPDAGKGDLELPLVVGNGILQHPEVQVYAAYNLSHYRQADTLIKTMYAHMMIYP